jgi:hypothetical protein
MNFLVITTKEFKMKNLGQGIVDGMLMLIIVGAIYIALKAVAMFIMELVK